MWPSSSTTSTAVSWSIGWLIVAMTPMFIMTLMTSLAFTAMRCASSATVTVSPICTSRLTGAAGRSKPCCVETLTCTGRRDLEAWCCFFFLKRALASLDTCSSARCARRRASRSGSRDGLARSPASRRRSASCTLAGFGLATRLFFGGHARFFVGATLRFLFQLQALPCLGFALLRLQALLLQPILFLRLVRAFDVVLGALDLVLVPVDFLLLHARLLFEHAAIEVGLLAAHLDVDHARAALRARRP